MTKSRREIKKLTISVGTHHGASVVNGGYNSLYYA